METTEILVKEKTLKTTFILFWTLFQSLLTNKLYTKADKTTNSLLKFQNKRSRQLSNHILSQIQLLGNIQLK